VSAGLNPYRAKTETTWARGQRVCMDALVTAPGRGWREAGREIPKSEVAGDAPSTSGRGCVGWIRSLVGRLTYL
jgi:hypothetical protein